MKILLADDHNVLRKGLRRILEEQPDLEVVGEAADGREAVTLANTLHPDIVVMDIAMPLMNGLEATRQILLRHSDLNVLILSMYSDENYVVQVLRAGARGYLLKDTASLPRYERWPTDSPSSVRKSPSCCWVTACRGCGRKASATAMIC